MIGHIVLFKFKEENKIQNIERAKELLLALEDLIPELVMMQVGINFDSADRAMDLSLYSLFESKEDLTRYASHPEHLKVVTFIKEVTEYSKVCDYEV